MPRKKVWTVPPASPAQVRAWEEARDSGGMIEALRKMGFSRTKAGRRSLRLFAIACCRCLGPLMGEGDREALTLAEQFASGEVEASAVMASSVDLGRRLPPPTTAGAYARHAVLLCLYPTQTVAVVQAVCATAQQARAYHVVPNLTNATAEEWREASLLERAAQCAVLRDIFGNPYRPLSPRPFPAHVVQLARDCEEGGRKMIGLLADALDDLGEDAAASHCRQDGHVRGCHVLDWVLRP